MTAIPPRADHQSFATAAGAWFRDSYRETEMTMCEAMGKAIELAARKGFGVYVMRDVGRSEGYVASIWCDHCPAAVVGVVMPDGSFFGM